jgi:hypothetical protein
MARALDDLLRGSAVSKPYQMPPHGGWVGGCSERRWHGHTPLRSSTALRPTLTSTPPLSRRLGHRATAGGSAFPSVQSCELHAPSPFRLFHPHLASARTTQRAPPLPAQAWRSSPTADPRPPSQPGATYRVGAARRVTSTVVSVTRRTSQRSAARNCFVADRDEGKPRPTSPGTPRKPP